MSAIDPFQRLVEEWQKKEEAERDYRLHVAQTIRELESRIRELEVGGPEPEPSPSKLALVPFTEPPLLQNRGTWTDADYERGSALDADGNLRVTLGQKAQPVPRVVRHDWGLQKPGSGNFLREPQNRLRRYELRITVPDDFDAAGEMVNLFQWHTHSAKRPPYLSFFLWGKSAYLRHNRPDESREDYKLGPIKKGHTYHVAVEANWSRRGDGKLHAWVDGNMILAHTGANFRAEEEAAPYVVFGPYFPSIKEAFKATFIFSDLKVGDL